MAERNQMQCCKSKGWEFVYYSKIIGKSQKEQNCGNYFHSINLGMNHIELDTGLYREFISSLSLAVDCKTFIIDQGGAVKEAQEGLEVLADEIRNANLKVKSLATPSGTGTTALFLALSLPEFKVYTTPCVGDSTYLKEQMQALHRLPDNLVILEPTKKYHFAKPYPEFLDIYKKLLASGIEFDLLYAPGMWQALLEQTDEEILYIHSGGVSGNESMLKRYQKIGRHSRA